MVGAATATTLLLIAVAAAGGCGGLAVGDLREDGGGGSSSGSSGPGPTEPSPPLPKPSFDGSFPDEDGGGPTGQCGGTAPVDATTLPYKSPFVSAGSCTAANLTALTTYVDGGGTFPGWKTSVPAPCATCIFGLETDALWKPILEDGGGNVAGLNVGGCIAVASGSDACGRTYQQWFTCRFEACVDCPDGDSAALQKCLAAASKGSCKKAFDAVSLVCGDPAIADAETTCDGMNYVFEGPIRAQCIGL